MSPFPKPTQSRGKFVSRVLFTRSSRQRPHWVAVGILGVLISSACVSPVFGQQAAVEAVQPAPSIKPAAGVSTNAVTLRVQLVREAAMSAAMRAALAKQSERINKLLDEHGRLLDDTYDFATLMLPNSVVPPVIRKVERVTEQSGDLLRYSAAQFRIVRQATFATRPPTWRTYLPIPIWSDLGTTHQSLLPITAEERAAAQEGVNKGWQAGIDQANSMFFKGLTRLQNDWVGMMTYHALLKSNMVTAPIVDRQDTAVSGNSDSMVVDQSTYRIEARPIFNPNMSQWLALLDTTGASSFLEAAMKAKDNESARATVAAPSLAEMLKTWGGR